MKASPDPAVLQAAVLALGKAARHEQKNGCTNSYDPRGLDAWIDDWLADNPDVERHPQLMIVVKTLRGYDTFALYRRTSCIDAALVTLRMLHEHLKDPSAPAPVAPPLSPAADREKLPAAAPRVRSTPPTTVSTDAPAARDHTLKKPKARAAPPAGAKPVTLDSHLEQVPGVGVENAKKFRRLGVRTIRDLLYHFPSRHADRSNRQLIADLRTGEEAAVVGTIVDSRSFSMRSGGKGLEIKLEDESGILKLSFFRQPWLEKQLRVGMQIMASGKIESFNGMRQMSGPKWEHYAESGGDLLHVGRLAPVHHLTEGLVENNARALIKRLVDGYAGMLVDPLPAAVRERQKLIPLPLAVRQIHFPDDTAQLERARERLSFDEFIAIQLGVLQRRQIQQHEISLPIPYNDAVHAAFQAALPFALTNAQTRAIGEIFQDIATPVPMARLLQGDVGSGKTAVAAAAALQAIAAGYQAAIMAPTEILAEQHYRGLSNLLGPIQIPGRTGVSDSEKAARMAEIQLLLGLDPERPTGVRIALLTGSLGVKERRRVLEGIATGEIDLVVGTHALITESVTYHRLGLAVVDEQHRFGVEQRQALKDKGTSPHLLVMTATPIPRTLTMTIYGDLDTSVLDELPPGRQKILTKRIRTHERDRAYKHIRKEVSAGRQAFVICPLVEESETLDVPSAEEMHTKLQSDIFPDLRVTLIHGRMSAKDKDAVMIAFRNHEYDILVATAVIEVGIDIPNATTVVIEGADRFGLAQLHQFRGRVGRGSHRSFCILVSDSQVDTTNQRLEAMEATTDGFVLAEKDLELRGPGEFFGTRQSGLPDLKVAKLTDTDILTRAQAEARVILRADPELSHIEHAQLRSLVEAFWARAVEAN